MDNCSICLLELGERNFTTLECGHQFHYRCIFRWNAQHNNCPVCRQPISAEERSPELVENQQNINIINNEIYQNPPALISDLQYEMINFQNINEYNDLNLINIENNHGGDINIENENNHGGDINIENENNHGGDINIENRVEQNGNELLLFQNDINSIINIINNIINNIPQQENPLRQNLILFRDYAPHLNDEDIGLERYCYNCSSSIYNCDECGINMCECENPEHIVGINPFYNNEIEMNKTCKNCFLNRDNIFIYFYTVDYINNDNDYNFMRTHYNNYYVNHTNININYEDYPNYEDFLRYISNVNGYNLNNQNDNINEDNQYENLDIINNYIDNLDNLDNQNDNWDNIDGILNNDDNIIINNNIQNIYDTMVS